MWTYTPSIYARISTLRLTTHENRVLLPLNSVSDDLNASLFLVRRLSIDSCVVGLRLSLEKYTVSSWMDTAKYGVIKLLYSI